MESTTINNDINALKEVRELFNEVRSNLLHKETKEAIYNFLKEKEQKGSLTNKHKKVLKNIDR